MKNESHKDCLSEVRLVAAYYGEATAEETAHRRGCIECARRMKALEADLAVIGEALSESRPDGRSAESGGGGLRGSAARYWMPAAAAALIAFTVLWRSGADEPRVDEHARVADPPQSATANQAPVDLDQELAFLAAALDGGVPCALDTDAVFSSCSLAGSGRAAAGDTLGLAGGYGVSDEEWLDAMFGVGS